MDNAPLLKNLPNLLGENRGCLVEIGAGNQSTRFLAGIAKQRGVKFYSVDPDPKAHRPFEGSINIHQTGEDFFRSFTEEILFCYLDGYHWANHWENPNVREYQGCTKELSEKSHLEQSQLLLPHLRSHSLVLFDDTGVEPPGVWEHHHIMKRIKDFSFYGKGALAIPFLLENGLKILGYTPNSLHGGPKHQRDQILLEKP